MRKEAFRNPEPGFGFYPSWFRHLRHWHPRRRMRTHARTSEEKTRLLEKYKAFLERELEGVKVRLAELQKKPEKETNDNQA